MFTKIHGRNKFFTPPAQSLALLTRSPRLRAYTLVEVLIIVLVMLTLAALLLPILQSGKDTAKLAVCTANMKQIYNGIMGQSVKNQETFLTSVDPYKWEIYAEALVESEVMICPMESDVPNMKQEGNYIFLPEPPPSMEQGVKESDTHLFAFREQASLALESALRAMTELGRYGRDGEHCRHESNGVIEGGKLVDVFYFSYDPATMENIGGEGEIWFSGDLVLGVIGDTPELNESDSILGIEDYSYFTGGCRGLSHCGSEEWADAVEITRERRTLKHMFSHASLSCKDDFRVITDIGAGSSYAMNVEAPGSQSREGQLLLTDAHIPWINFEDGVDTHDPYSFMETVDARHFGKVNAVTRQGSVELFELSEILPDSRVWRK